MSDRFAVDTEKMRRAGRELETYGTNLQALQEEWFDLLASATRACGSDKNGKAMAKQLNDSSDQTGRAIKSFAAAVRGGGQGIQNAADAFVATEESNADAAKNLEQATTTGVDTGDVSTGQTSGTSTGTTTTGGSGSTHTGKH
ncbi:hypothetical protein KIH74_28180 [Kineosporia sp. J2-2]|uniref:Excreted virulence factor EspC (Type VII ESX diderm) n=1 Tax=Kineosporia corallincola TaxID=2835133 RepID=A0ABS5TPV3_9ACTN|nr:hypothetical protein [Kineosporia corallincola]MBT0772853.1 hypothetical protein [Kineosporia corallincola]